MADMPALKAESVGLKLTELTISNLIEVGKNIAQDDPELKFAKNKVEWIEFAETWRERAETTRVVTVVLGRQNGKQELGTIGVGDLEGNFLCVPIRKAMRRGDNKLAAWISHNMKALHDVLRDQRILKVISPADLTFQLLLDEEIEAGQAIAPMCDPVLCAADGNPAKFNFWVDRFSLEHPGFGAKIAAHITWEGRMALTKTTRAKVLTKTAPPSSCWRGQLQSDRTTLPHRSAGSTNCMGFVPSASST